VTPTIRNATPADAALIQYLTRAAWQGRVAANSSAYRETEEQLARELAEGCGVVLLLGETPIGSVRASPVPGAWEVRRMGVLPAYRARGHAELMMDAIVERAHAAGIAELRLGVRRDQPRLVAFYGKMGFELAPGLGYAHANPAAPEPWVMRRVLTRPGRR